METTVINGKTYKPITNSTLRHDTWTQAQILRSGLDRMEMRSGETPDAYALRVYREAALTGDVFLLLGGLIMPVEIECVDWSVKIAEQTAEALAAVTSTEDKATVRGYLFSAIMGFLAAGLSYLMTSPSYSPRPGSGEFDTWKSAPASSAIGEGFSASLPDMTGTQFSAF